MNPRTVYLLIFQVIVLASATNPVFAQIGPESETQNENLPLAVAKNSLRDLFPGTKPSLQRGFKSSGDIWLLYSKVFDGLSGAAQSYLLRKYGVAEFTPTSKINGYNQEVKLNDSSLDLLLRVQSETSSAISGKNIVVGYNDTGLYSYGSGISYSKDAGQTWKQTVPPLLPFGDGLGDPVMAAGPGGAFYFSMLGYDGSGLSAISMTKSTDGGASWSKPVNATMNSTTWYDFHDKPWLAVDNSNSGYRGNIYLSWVRFTSSRLERDGIGFIRSIDGGKTWSQIMMIGRLRNSEGLVQGPMIAIGPDGEVYVAYFDSRIPGIVVAKSTNGGESFGEPVTALQDASLQLSRTLSGGFADPPFPSVAVDNSSGPNRGAVYITVGISPSKTDGGDVVVVKSVDGGSTWSSPLKVNDDQTDTDQFQPSLAVALDGTIGIMWYDRRNDPTNNVLLDVYVAASSDGARTFLPNRRLTPGNWILLPTPFGLRSNYHGDYNQISADATGFVFNWASDISGTDPNVYAAVFPTAELLKQPQDFILAAKTLALNVFAGSNASFALNHARGGAFVAAISLEATTSGAGLTYRFSPGELRSAGEFNLTIEVPLATAPGTYTVIVSGKGGGLIRSTTLRLTVHDPAELRQTPRAISNIRLALFQPKAAADAAGDWHVVSLDGSSRELIYTRHRGGAQVGSSPVVRLTNLNLRLTNHSLAMDGTGTITVLWRQEESDTFISNLFLSRSTDGGLTFSEPANITGNTTSRTTVSSPSLVVAPSGGIHLAFVQSDRTSVRQDIFYMRSSDGGSMFSEKVNVTKVASSNSWGTLPVIALDQTEAVNIVYRFFPEQGSAGIFFARSVDRENFTTPIRVSKTGENYYFTTNPSIAVQPSGEITVVYTSELYDSVYPDVYMTRSSNGGTDFSEPAVAVRSTDVGLSPGPPVLAVDATGNIGIAWVAFGEGPLFPGGRDVLFCKSNDAGQTFSGVVNLSNDIGHQRMFPIVVLDGSGQLALLWEDETGGNSQIFLVTP